MTSPLGFAVGADGTLYVAEAFIGQLTAVDKKGGRTALVQSVEGQGTSGVDAKGKGTLSYTLSVPPEDAAPQGDTFLNRIGPNGKTTREANLWDFEQDVNPDAGNTYGLVGASQGCVAQYDAFNAALPEDEQGPPAVFTGVLESNPYAIAIDKDGSRLVADAAGNALLRVSPNGKTVTTVAVLPPVRMALTEEVLSALEDMSGMPLDACVGADYDGNPVPTDVEIGPDGNYYVSSLPGFPEAPGAGSVFKIDRVTHAVTKLAGGLTGAVDLAVGADGSIYVAELFAFQVSRIAPGADSATESVFVECPTAVEIAPNGGVLVAESGICGDDIIGKGRIISLDI